MRRRFKSAPCLTCCASALALAGLAVSCVSPTQDTAAAAKSRPVWPPAPDEPRIRYVRSIASAADIGRTPSRWARAVRFITGETGEPQRFLKPFGVALDEAGNLCVTDTDDNSVCCLDLARKQWRRWQSAGKKRFASPVAVACRNGILYVADSELGQVLGVDDKGREVLAISNPLQRPSGLALVDDSLAVADSAAHAVFVFDLRGQLRSRFGERGAGPGQFNFPTHIATDKAGHLLVTDSLNSRVQVFDGQGKFLSEIGSAGDTPGHFGRPKGVAADSFGHIYVVDAVFDKIQIFDMAGQLLLTWGEGGTGPGQFGVPAGIAIGPENRIYVTDSYNRRVQVFEYLGEQ